MKTKLFCLLITSLLLGVKSALAQEARATNIPSKTYSRTPLAEGPTVVGNFEGRFPCSEITKDWKQPIRPECTKVKWGLTLLQDPTTFQPTIYRLNRTAREGKWAIVRGTKTDPDAVVYQLDSDKPDVSIYLLKGDDNVLFILDQERNLRVGDFYLSYTLNRVVN